MHRPAIPRPSLGTSPSNQKSPRSTPWRNPSHPPSAAPVTCKPSTSHHRQPPPTPPTLTVAMTTLSLPTCSNTSDKTTQWTGPPHKNASANNPCRSNPPFTPNNHPPNLDRIGNHIRIPSLPKKIPIPSPTVSLPFPKGTFRPAKNKILGSPEFGRLHYPKRSAISSPR